MMSLLKFVMTSTLVMNMPSDHHVVGDHEPLRSYSGCVLEFGKAKSVCQPKDRNKGHLAFAI